MITKINDFIKINENVELIKEGKTESDAVDTISNQALVDIDKAYDSIKSFYRALNDEANTFDKNDMLSNGKSAYNVFSSIADSVEGNAFHVLKECSKYLNSAVSELKTARTLKMEETLPFRINPISSYSNIKEIARSLMAKIVKEYKLSNGYLKFAPDGAGNYEMIIELGLDDKGLYARYDTKGYGDYGHFYISINDKEVIDDRFNNKRTPSEGQDSNALAIHNSKGNEGKIRKFLDVVLNVIK